MEGCFHSVAEIRKAIERRGQTFPVEEKRREIGRRVHVRGGLKPGLDIPLDADGDAEFLQGILEPGALTTRRARVW